MGETKNSKCSWWWDSFGQAPRSSGFSASISISGFHWSFNQNYLSWGKKKANWLSQSKCAHERIRPINELQYIQAVQGANLSKLGLGRNWTRCYMLIFGIPSLWLWISTRVEPTSGTRFFKGCDRNDLLCWVRIMSYQAFLAERSSY